MPLSKTAVELKVNSLGFKEVFPKPSAAELRDYYNNKYFGANKGQYSASYSDAELAHKSIDANECLSFVREGASTVLDIGCGEGFLLHFFHNRGWQVSGIDLTLDGINQFFPELAENIIVGDLYESIRSLIGQNKKYDLVTANNVLEHVPDPAEALSLMKLLLAPGGVLRINVPNDDSPMQREAVTLGLVQENFWVAYPDHLNYFNFNNLPNLLADEKLKTLALLGEFPIDLFLFNPATNYVQDPSTGRNCHLTRVTMENLLFSQGIDKIIAFRRGCAEALIGRSITAYCVSC